MPKTTLTPEQRFWAKVDKTDTCWTWTASTNHNGYGTFWLGKRTLAHRVAYQWLVGEIPEGLELDHICRNRSCVNPDHLEPVTHDMNVKRGALALTHCAQGHAYTEANTRRTDSRGYRGCRACHNAIGRRRYWTLKSQGIDPHAR